MMKKFFIVSTAVLSLCLICATGVFAELKEGLWEITTRVSIQGMPQSMPPTTFRQCITKSDPVPQNRDQNYECKTVNQNITGNTVTYSVECKGAEGTIQTTGKTSYSDNSMTGDSTTVLKMKGQPQMQMISNIKGKYIGACRK